MSYVLDTVTRRATVLWSSLARPSASGSRRDSGATEADAYLLVRPIVPLPVCSFSVASFPRFAEPFPPEARLATYMQSEYNLSTLPE